MFRCGGGTIKRSFILAMLLLFSAVALLNVNYSYGIDVVSSDPEINNQLINNTNNQIDIVSTGNSYTKDQIGDAASRVKAFVETNKRLPNHVTISSQKVEISSFLYLMTTSLVNTNQGNTSSINEFNFKFPKQSPSSNKAGDLYKSEYSQMALNIKNCMLSTGSAPEVETSSLGNLNFESLVYIYSRILGFEFQNKRLPNYITVSASIINQSTKSVTSLGKGHLNGLVGITGLDILAKYINQNLNHRSGAAHTAEGVEKTGLGDCWGLSDWAAKVLSANGYPVKVVQGSTSASSRHRWLNVFVNGKWITFEPSLVTKKYGSKHYTTTCAKVSSVVATYNC